MTDLVIVPPEGGERISTLKGRAMSHRPDTVVAKDSGGHFTAHPEGQFAMLCVDVVNLGIAVEQYADQEPREVAKVALVFASGERQGDMSLTLVTTEMTISASEKANLRKFVEAWRGKSYTPDQVAQGLPIGKLHGTSALISVEHVTTSKGRQFAKIRSISPLPAAMSAPSADVVEQYVRPKYLLDRKASYAAALAKHRASPPPVDMVGSDNEPDDETDVPF